MPNLIIDKIQTKQGEAQINYNGLVNKPDLTPFIGQFEITSQDLKETDYYQLIYTITLSEETTYDNIKAALEAGRTVFLKEKNGIRFYILSDSIENQYYGFSWCGPIYQDSQVCEIDYQYFKVNKDNTGSGFKSYYYANSIYKVRFMENGAAATDEWKRLDQAYDNVIRMLPVLIDTTTNEYYSFKQYKTVDSVNHYIFYNIKYDTEANAITYIEADLNTQDGTTALTTKQILLDNSASAVTYQGGNGIQVLDTTDENVKNIELAYGKTVSQNFEIPLISIDLTVADSAEAGQVADTYLDNSNFTTHTVFTTTDKLNFYQMNSDGTFEKIEEVTQYYYNEDKGNYVIGVNINEAPVQNGTIITSFTKKDTSKNLCGIITLTQDNRELAENEFDIFSRFYYLSAGAGVSQNFSFLVTKESKKVESLPDNFLSYGKTQELKLNYSGATTPENLKNLNPNVDDEVLSLCIPAVHYNNTNTDDVFYSSTEDETKKIYSSFSNTYEYNNTYNFNHIYSENTVSAVVEGLNDEELTSYTLESNAALDEKIKEAISGNTFTFRFSVDYQDQYSINISWSNLKNLRYLRCNVTETLDYIAENMTWTTTGSYSCGIFVLATFNSGMQFWFPLTASSSHYLDIQLWDISRCITMKKSIPVKQLPTIGYDGDDSVLKDNENLMSAGDIRDLIISKTQNSVAYQLTAEGTDASKPVANWVLTNKFTEIENKLANKADATSTQSLAVNNNNSINTENSSVASIQAAMAYDSVPTQNSENLIKSKDLYTLQQNLIEQIGGKTKGYVFDTNAELQAWLTDENKAKLKVGDILYIKETDYPDYWWDGTSTQYLETQKVDLTNYRTKSDHDFQASFKKAVLSTDSQTILNNTINSCVEISLQDGESLTSIKTSQDIQENFFPITVLKVYLDGNLNNSLYNFSFNTYNPMHSSYLNFLPEDAIEGTYYGSDTYLMTSPNGANSYKQFFLQVWVVFSATAPKLYLKRTDFTPLT